MDKYEDYMYCDLVEAWNKTNDLNERLNLENEIDKRHRKDPSFFPIPDEIKQERLYRRMQELKHEFSGKNTPSINVRNEVNFDYK